jgi:hypothetical protein
VPGTRCWQIVSLRHALGFCRRNANDRAVFDLPHELRGQQDHTAPGQAAANLPTTFSQLKPEHPYGSPMTRLTNEPAVDSSSSEDWTFLKGFGDPTHEFYELDVQLRGLLDGGLDAHQANLTVRT